MEHYKELKMACTMVCLNSFSGGILSSKIVLAGTLLSTPYKVQVFEEASQFSLDKQTSPHRIAENDQLSTI